MTASASSERWRSGDRLCQRQDFVRCYRRGRRRYGPSATLYIYANGRSGPRFGTTASRKVGPSVVRHRLKRWVREIVRRFPRRQALPAADIVVHLNRTAGNTRFGAFRDQLCRELERLARDSQWLH